MENKILRFTMRDLTEKSSKKLIKLNDESINYGLVLSENDVNNIMKHTNETLTKIGRIETSTSSLEKIIEIVYSSPYTDKENYVENINDMQEIFYYFKSEVLDLISDDEVIEAGGSRDEEMLKTFGDFPVRTSKQEDCVRSDQLLYDGRWFECMSSRLSRNTILKHWTSTFKLIPVSENKEPSNSEMEETE